MRDKRSDGPIVVLSYAFAGAESLTRALSATPWLACTSGTGLIPLCHATLATWQHVDGTTGPPSRLAIKTTRARADTVVTSILAGAGAKRWCETAFTQPAAADSFLWIFPTATVVCVYRDLPGVLAEGLRAYPWGLDGSPFWFHSVRHLGNNVAAIAAYWSASTESLLEFEAKHTSSCLRVRCEDLTADQQSAAVGILTSLGLDPSVAAHERDSIAWPEPTIQARSAIPAERIPPELLRRVYESQRKLGYIEFGNQERNIG